MSRHAFVPDCLAMDLTPLVHEPQRSVASYVQERIDRFAADVRARVESLEAVR